MAKFYNVHYELAGSSYIAIEAESPEEAREEVERIMCGDKPLRAENQWIDQDVIWDIEWSTTDITQVSARREY